MRPFLIAAATVIALGALWLLGAQRVALLVDPLFMAPLASMPANPVGWNGVYLQFGSSPTGADGHTGGWNGRDIGTGSYIMDLEGPGPGDPQAAALNVDTHDRLVISAHGRSLVLGPRAGVLSGGDGPIAAYVAEAGDVTSLTIERSGLSWPVFETNFMTGRSPTWRRHLYYHLSWKKRSGARLDLVWRYEQGFYPADGWSAPGGPDITNGLIRADVR